MRRKKTHTSKEERILLIFLIVNATLFEEKILNLKFKSYIYFSTYANAMQLFEYLFLCNMVVF